MSLSKENGMTTLRLTAALAVGIIVWTAGPAMAQDQGKTEAAKLASESRAALQNLYAGVPLAKELGKTAAAILVFPSVTKAGLGIGGQYGEGTLLKGKITKITPK
jgi:lipid-binding SYLF domain-containing protein